MKVLKDLVPDLSEFMNNKSIKPWLTQIKEKRDKTKSRGEKNLMDFMSVYFVLVAQLHAQAIGGT